MREATHRLDQLRDAVDDLIVIQGLYSACKELWEYVNANPVCYTHRNFEILQAEMVKRGRLLKELRDAAALAWLEGSPLDLDIEVHKGL